MRRAPSSWCGPPRTDARPATPAPIRLRDGCLVGWDMPVTTVVSHLGDIASIGREATTGGYRRLAWTDADLTLREWFIGQASGLGLDLEVDRNGNIWAWWGDSTAPDAVITGSHLDSVPDGGNYDGPLGIASALTAVAQLKGRGVRPRRPLAVACFTDEEGARFGVACIGSRLAAGVLEPDKARALRDADGVTLDEALRHVGRDPESLGAEPDRLARIGAFVELHVEQGRGLIDMDAAIGVGTAILPHGRWRVDIAGQPNHAGTTLIADRRDPMMGLAALIESARREAAVRDSVAHAARATVGKVECTPNAVNAIPSHVTGWLDARADDEATLDSMLEAIGRDVLDLPGLHVQMLMESRTPAQVFEPTLSAALASMLGGAPMLATGAGHDAGVLAEVGVPSAMLFVRNPTGISHSPEEYAEDADCEAGGAALADVLAELVTAESLPR
jgi:N-carbamoyl-L-amino-acid hydrolase